MSADPDDLKYVSEAELVSVREQIQEDIRSYLDEDTCCASVLPRDEMLDDLCQIVVDNFKKLEE